MQRKIVENVRITPNEVREAVLTKLTELTAGETPLLD